jgi:anaerobic magnesium-protoporphyrin IX monomethyl ester cyclase
VMKQARQAGIGTGSFMMCGYPGEKIGDILQTAKFIRDAAPHEVTLGMAYPIRGTRFYEETESTFMEPYRWDLFNERQIRLKRPYHNRFYRNALRFLRRTHRVVVAVNSRQALSNRFQAFVLKIMMYLTRWL